MKKQTKSDIAGLGLQVHPSSIGMFLRCPYHWQLVYIEGMRRAPAAALAVGSGVHAGLEYNFRQKIKTGVDCRLDEVLDAFDMSFKEQIKGVDWNKEDITKERPISKEQPAWSITTRFMLH